MGNTEDLTLQNQVLSFYCKEQGMKAVRTIIEYGKADILKLRNFRQMARYGELTVDVLVNEVVKNLIKDEAGNVTGFNIATFVQTIYPYFAPEGESQTVDIQVVLQKIYEYFVSEEEKSPSEALKEMLGNMKVGTLIDFLKDLFEQTVLTTK